MKKIFLTIAILTVFGQSHAAAPDKGDNRKYKGDLKTIIIDSFMSTPKSAAEQLALYTRALQEEHAKSKAPQHPIKTLPDINNTDDFPALGSR